MPHGILAVIFVSFVPLGTEASVIFVRPVTEPFVVFLPFVARPSCSSWLNLS